MNEELDQPQRRAMAAYAAVQVLMKDVEYAATALSVSHMPFAVRSYVRAVFACVEALSYAMRLAASDLLLHRAKIRSFHDTQKLVLLSGREGLIQGNGVLRLDRRRQPFKNMVAFTLRTLAEELGEDVDPIFSDHRWDLFKKAVDVRDRMMHPKAVDELRLEEAELKDFVAAQEWFFELSGRLMQSHTLKRIERKRERSRAAVE